MKKGYFFVLEGGEGSGKTSTSHLIKKKLQQSNIECIITREPGGNKFAEQIRDIIFNNEIDAKTEALLFAAARRDHLENVILPALKENKVVICDRYIISSLVYQGVARGLGIADVKKLNEWATDNTTPNLTFFYDISPEQALKRITNDENRELNRFDLENLNFHNKLYEGYKQIAQTGENIITVDASKSLEKVTDNIVNHILEYING